MIVIAHRLATVKRLDRIIVVEKGQILEEGSHSELIEASKLYNKLWEIQSEH